MTSLWQEGRLGPMTVRNRTVRSATNEHLARRDGQITPAWSQAQIDLARNEVGLVISGHFCVDPDQRADEGQPVLDGRTDAALLRATAREIHRWGGRFAIQLSHSGGKAMEGVNGRPAKGPADFTLPELDQLVDRFVSAARLCRNCGVDGVQIHTAHGYLLSSFLNPQENHRTDQYGGSLDCRFRLVRRILEGVRTACGPDFALLVKADCNGCGDLPGLLRLYQACGVDGIEISGVDFNRRAGERQPFYLQELLAARAGIDTPLILVGGIFSLQSAQAVLDAGIDFAAFSRALICQSDFVARLHRGEAEESGCRACNGCYQIYRRRPVRCVLHQMPVSQLQQVFHPAEGRD